MKIDIYYDIFDIMPDVSQLGDLLHAARSRALLSQRALAARAGTTQAVVARIETGSSEPSIATLRKLLAAAGFELGLEVVERLASDPVIERYKRDVDQTLLIENLRKTPEQRVQSLVAMARLSAEMGRARRVAERTR